MNTPWTIDEGYRVEIDIIIINHSKEEFLVKECMKIAQMVIMPVLRPEIVESTELSETNRGTSEFGSTGV